MQSRRIEDAGATKKTGAEAPVVHDMLVGQLHSFRHVLLLVVTRDEGAPWLGADRTRCFPDHVVGLQLRPPTENAEGTHPYEYVCKVWTKEPERFKINPAQHTVELNT
jgi:hypothetical protein